MYYLSKICCFCLRSDIKLKLLNEINFCTSPVDIIKLLIEESAILELGHVLLVCEDCTEQVKKMHFFCQTSIKNNEILTKYLRELHTSGSHVGDIQVRINDIRYSTDPVLLISKEKFCIKENINKGNKDTIAYKTLAEENCQYEDQTKEEDEEIKIEIHDDFKEMDDPLECESNEMLVKFPEEPLEETEEVTLVKEEPILEVTEMHNCETKKGNEVEQTKIEIFDDFTETYGHLKYESNEMPAEFPEKPKEIKKELIEENSEQYKCEDTCVLPGHPLPQCSKESNMCELKIHNSEHHTENQHKCETCGKSFTKLRNLTKHISIHTGEKPYKCEICEKPFAQRRALTIHMSVHTGEKPHKCQTCGKSFTSKSNLTNHTLLRTGEKRHECQICEKRFSSKHTLNKHKLIHTGERPHKCEVCEKSFTQKSTLTGHMIVHTGEKPYECKTCGRSFNNRMNLKRHGVLHTNDRIYKCKFCGKSFNYKRNLMRHDSLHANNRLHKCETCALFFECRQSIHSDKNHYKCNKCK